jgi:hypothetical protein
MCASEFEHRQVPNIIPTPKMYITYCLRQFRRFRTIRKVDCIRCGRWAFFGSFSHTHRLCRRTEWKAMDIHEGEQWRWGLYINRHWGEHPAPTCSRSDLSEPWQRTTFGREGTVCEGQHILCSRWRVMLRFYNETLLSKDFAKQVSNPDDSSSWLAMLMTQQH